MLIGFLAGKSDGSTPQGRPIPIWEDNIKMNLREIGWGLKGMTAPA
jgi:hypothetical protein